ncbi:peptidase inhibitor family I36 protein [Actinosynnema sp. NPDC023587]|uniref:peptidase inhibitor family I36 protein n=1 Tax=Actinosynnema sp. NPDC023587 TaxID=3154695 RepID=UPI00340B10AE
MKLIGRRLARAGAALCAAAALVLSTTPAATAATPRNGVCEDGEFCLYYYTELRGSVSDFTTSVLNYGSSQPSCYDFKGPGDGQGLCVKNNARSAWNRRGDHVWVFFNSNHSGDFDVVGSGSMRDLVNTFDNNASHGL